MQGQPPPAVQRPRCIGPPAVYSKPLSFLPPRPLVIPNRAQPGEEPAVRQQRHNSRGDNHHKSLQPRAALQRRVKPQINVGLQPPRRGITKAMPLCYVGR